ncbi:MFS transporter [Paludisphaera borealis]|uniref:Multidrug resistance protein 3 n=1 Tax=Paludisphaera borealis TaxID=1387353 RepID=A0A1U7CQZ9_9BACT|nr:MFS transporter [Paludisphaera borealis]APW61326.1 Multidrug resistance protein 3 [Paludisphaera borealis]
MSQSSNESSAGGVPSPVPPSGASPLGEPRPAPWWAWGALGFLFLAQMLGSFDHWLFTALILPIGLELELLDEQAAWLSSLTLIAASLWAPTLGFFADRMRRPRLAALAIAAASLATIVTGMAASYDQLQAARVLVGIGGVSFRVIALTLLMDLFPRGVRARVLAAYFLALPAGAALGLGLGPALDIGLTWHTAFLIAGAPGLLVAMAALVLPEPARGISEGVAVPRLRLHEAVGPSVEDYVDLMVNSSYTYSVFGLTFTTFVIGGLFYWLPSFLTGVRMIPADRVGPMLAVVLPTAMAVGIAGGGWLADRWSKTNPRALFLVPAGAALTAIPVLLVVIFGKSQTAVVVAVFAATALLFANLGPCFAIIARVTAPNMRAVACGSALAVTHLLGDVWSPGLMGWVADVFGQTDSMATPFGKALAALGATPRVIAGRDPENLAAAFLTLPPALAIAAVVLLAGAWHLPRETALMLAKLRAAPPYSFPPQPQSRENP